MAYTDMDTWSSRLLNESLEEYKKRMKWFAKESWEQTDLDATAKKDLIKTRDEGARADLVIQKAKAADVEKNYRSRVKVQRDRSDAILDQQRAGIWLEANIKAAAAWRQWKLSESQLAKISHDITDSFWTSLAKAKSDNLAFTQWLDKSLKDLWFDMVEKEKMFTALESVLDKDEVAPMLDAIASKATTRESFDKYFSAEYSVMKKKEIESRLGRSDEEQRYSDEAKTWASSSIDQRKRIVSQRLENIVHSLTPTEKKRLLKESIQSEDWTSVYTKLWEIEAREKIAKETSLKSEALAASAYATAIEPLETNSLGWKSTASKIDSTKESVASSLKWYKSTSKKAYDMFVKNVIDNYTVSRPKWSTAYYNYVEWKIEAMKKAWYFVKR